MNIFQRLDKAYADFYENTGKPPKTVYLGSDQFAELQYLATDTCARRGDGCWTKYRGCSVVQVFLEDHIGIA